MEQTTIIIAAITVTGIAIIILYRLWSKNDEGSIRYDPAYLQAVEKEREKKYASYSEIGGLLVAPGGEIEALQGELDFLDFLCETEEEFQAGLDKLSDFIEPARQNLKDFMNEVPAYDFDISDWREELEEAGASIDEASWLVENPVEALAQWRQMQKIN